MNFTKLLTLLRLSIVVHLIEYLNVIRSYSFCVAFKVDDETRRSKTLNELLDVATPCNKGVRYGSSEVWYYNGLAILLLPYYYWNCQNNNLY